MNVTKLTFYGGMPIVLTALTFLFGNVDTALITLLCCMIADVLSGWIRGVLLKNLNSHKGDGLFKKGLILLVVILAYQLQKLSGVQAVRDIVIYFYVMNEGLSVLENISQCGIPIPDVLKKLLEQLNSKGE